MTARQEVRGIGRTRRHASFYSGTRKATLNMVMNVTRQTVQLTSLAEQLTGVLFLPGTGGKFPAMIICHGAGEFKENYFELCECLAERGMTGMWK